jgi:PAS domain S-box-containing protein
MESRVFTPSDADRLTALNSYGVLDTAAEPRFDRIAQLAASVFEAPVAVVSFVDEHRLWFKARVGLDASWAHRDQSFCDHAVRMAPQSIMVVEDALADPRFANHPLVVGEPHLRFYTGAVLSTASGQNLGALCVFDHHPRQKPTETQLAQLRALADIAVDELERILTERRIAEKHKLLAMAESMSGVGHWRHEDSGRMSWSDEVYRIFGTDIATFEPTYEKTVGFFHEDDRTRCIVAMQRAVASNSGYEVELKIRRADGQLRDLLLKGSVELDDRGVLTAMFGVIQDVTEQNRALRVAQKSQAGYKLLADNMADVVTRIRLDGHSNYISPAVQNLIGYTPAEMAGRPAQDFVYEPDKPRILETFAELGMGLEGKSVEHRAIHKDGHPVWVESRFRLLRDANGKPDEMVAVIRDISDRKVLETQMLAARQAAEVAAAVKSDFLANMSHEIRTPLTSIIGFTSLAAAQPDMPELAKTYVERVEKASRSLLCTVNDILDFSKLEAGQVIINPQPTEVVKLCRSTLDMLMPQAAAKDLQLRMLVGADVDLSVMADPDRLRQILLNMVGNAVKFTDAGSVTLEVGYDDGALWVAVDDTGPGIEDDKLDKLFKRFSQVDGSLTRTHGGTGLGLAICKGLVEAMGGEIGADSRPGVGSRFWFAIPATLCEVQQSAPASEATDHLFGGVRILVVDDHPANRELARLFLSGAGAEIAEAVDGEDAVAVTTERPFDVILMDVRMPKLDGRGALKQIREGGGPNAAIPIIAYTADASQEEAGRLVELGFDAVVAKPVVAGALIIAVAEALSEWTKRTNAADVPARSLAG